jgi:hypothetical protein
MKISIFKLMVPIAAWLIVACARVAGETSSMRATPEIVVHRSPSCGCCEKWVDHLRAEGFLVKVIDTNEVGAFRQSLKVPGEHASCHTAVVDGYFIEGHVPGPDIRKLLAGKPAARGLAVPGMPAGSPGMEVPSGQVDAYETLLIDNEGRASVFARHGGN